MASCAPKTLKLPSPVVVAQPPSMDAKDEALPGSSIDPGKAQESDDTSAEASESKPSVASNRMSWHQAVSAYQDEKALQASFKRLSRASGVGQQAKAQAEPMATTGTKTVGFVTRCGDPAKDSSCGMSTFKQRRNRSQSVVDLIEERQATRKIAQRESRSSADRSTSSDSFNRNAHRALARVAFDEHSARRASTIPMAAPNRQLPPSTGGAPASERIPLRRRYRYWRAPGKPPRVLATILSTLAVCWDASVTPFAVAFVAPEVTEDPFSNGWWAAGLLGPSVLAIADIAYWLISGHDVGLGVEWSFGARARAPPPSVAPPIPCTRERG